MDIEQFIKDVLAQITGSVNKNEEGGDIKYTVDYTKGVDFNLAVTTTNSTVDGKGVSGGLRVRVVGAETSKNSKASSSLEVTSRIQFNVNLRKERI